MNDQLLDRLANSFDDFKERLIRIEENVKDVPGLKAELDLVKIELSKTKESSKSAHKRLDQMEQRQEQKDQDIKWLKRQIIAGAIGWVFTVLTAVTIIILKLK